MVSRIDNPDLRELRRDPRRRMFKHVQVLSLDKKATSAIDCTLRNISNSGAQLTGPGPSISRIPGQFYLVAPGQLRMIRCKVVWKAYEAVGVSFLSDPGHLTSGQADCADHEPDGTGEAAIPEIETPPEQYVLDRTTGAVVKLHEPMSSKMPDGAATPVNLAAILRDDGIEDIEAQHGRRFCYLPIEHLRPSPKPLRLGFNQEDLEGLAQSIRENGLLQPLIVRRRAFGDAYEIVAGERRWRVARLTDLRAVPVLIWELSDAEALEIAIIENVQRSDLSPLEEARGYAQLLDRYGYSQQQLAEAVGKSRSQVANMLRLLSLPDEVKSHLEDGKLSVGHARTLVAAKAPVELANQIIKDNLNVREAERLASSQQDPTVRRNGRVRNTGGYRELERTVSEALGLKVEIAGTGQSESQSRTRVAVFVETEGQLNEVCRRLARQD